MPAYKVVPWRTRSELLRVRDQVYQQGSYAAPLDLQDSAVDEINMWRYRGGVPHAIESTYRLMVAVLTHEKTQAASEMALQATYSYAMLYFVTGFCDLSQNKEYKRSMLDVALLDLNMPAAFVTLRHAIIHEKQTPPLRQLAAIAKKALEWLWGYYWVKLDAPPATLHVQVQVQAPVSAPVMSMSKEDRALDRQRQTPSTTPPALRAVLTTFLGARIAEIKAASSDTSARSSAGIAALSLIKLCRGRSANLALLSSLLVEERMLIPSNRKLSDSMSGAFLIWGNLLRRLARHQRKFLKSLIARLVVVMTAEGGKETNREAAQRWVVYVCADSVRAFTINECITAPTRRSIEVAEELLAGAEMEVKVRWTGMVELAERYLDEDEGQR